MGKIYIKIADQDGNILAEGQGENEVNLVYKDSYREGDRILVEAEERPGFYQLQLDDAKGHSLVYLKDNLEYKIPFGENRINLSPKVFSGHRHLLHVRTARPFEYEAYRNLAENVYDQHGEAVCYPHASANVETRGESVFAALNAIDGVTAASSHGEWPHESWGINRRPDAWLKLDFGRTVETDRIILYTRADFPHDNWWEEATIQFSDGSSLKLQLKKTGEAQEFTFEKKQIKWLTLCELIKADAPSPFPALVQIQVYGTEAK